MTRSSLHTQCVHWILGLVHGAPCPLSNTMRVTLRSPKEKTQPAVQCSCVVVDRFVHAFGCARPTSDQGRLGHHRAAGPGSPPPRVGWAPRGSPQLALSTSVRLDPTCRSARADGAPPPEAHSSACETGTGSGGGVERETHNRVDWGLGERVLLPPSLCSPLRLRLALLLFFSPRLLTINTGIPGTLEQPTTPRGPDRRRFRLRLPPRRLGFRAAFLESGQD